MGLEHHTIEFHADDLAEVTAEMRRIAVGADGTRWMNISPDVNDEEIHTGSVFWRMFSSRGPVVPRFTWVPAHTTKGKRVHCEVGLMHAAGRSVVTRLADNGVVAPADWVLQQDHTRRGIIYAVPPTTAEDIIVTWAMATIPVVSPFGFEPYFTATFSSAKG